MSEWIEQDHMDDNHLYVHLKNPELLDLSIFDRLSNDDFCLPCMLTNEKTASMVYAIEGYIPLHDFLSQYVFEKEEGYIFLHQLFEQAIASNRNKPVLFDLGLCAQATGNSARNTSGFRNSTPWRASRSASTYATARS